MVDYQAFLVLGRKPVPAIDLAGVLSTLSAEHGGILREIGPAEVRYLENSEDSRINVTVRWRLVPDRFPDLRSGHGITQPATNASLRATDPLCRKLIGYKLDVVKINAQSEERICGCGIPW